MTSDPRAQGLALTQRDLDLLCGLLTYGAMLPEQLQELYFRGRSRRRLNQRLRQLLDAGLAARRPMPLGLSAGLPDAPAPGVPWVYHLGPSAVPAVAARLGWDAAEVRRLARSGPPTALAHALAVVSLRVRAERAVREWGGEVRMEFLPERLVRHDYQVRAPGGDWRGESFRPDALLRLSFGGGPWRHHFVEVDLGHTGAGEWAAKARIAVRYRRAGLFARRYGAPGFSTLVCTTGVRRLSNLKRLLERGLDPGDAARFGLATLADVAARGPLAADWHVPGQDRPVSLKGLANEDAGGDPCSA